MEKVSEAYRTCIECHRDAITELTDKMSRELAQALGIANVAEVSKAPSVDRLMKSANKNVTRSVMGVKLFGTSENFSPAAMSTFSLIMKKKKQTDIIDIALENYDEIRINIVKDIKTVYQDLEVKAISRLESLYQYQVELSRNAIDQAKEMMDNEDKSELLETLADALKRLEAPKQILDANLPA
jgi:hypothetical protein